MLFHKLLFLVVFLAACGVKEDAKDSDKAYFDIDGYFDNEAQRLTEKAPLIQKRISHNRQEQTKNIRIANWKTELKLFTNSDINKPAWKASYRVKRNGLKTTYTALDSALKTKQITIHFIAPGQIKSISAYNQTSNMLYSSMEELHYYPDSLYSIRKHHRVKLLGENEYLILATF